MGFDTENDTHSAGPRRAGRSAAGAVKWSIGKVIHRWISAVSWKRRDPTNAPALCP